jgi:hypothetical protein
MKNLKKTLSGLLSLTLIVSLLIGCNKETETEGPFSISTIAAGTVDLNTATAPNNVPTNVNIVVTFSSDIDPATATEDNIKLVRDYDGAILPFDVTVLGKQLTVDPKENLGSGTLYKVQLNAGLKSKGGIAFTATERSFTTAGTFAPASVIAHFTFENSANDVVGSFSPAASDIANITFADSRKAAAGKAASFNGTSSIIEIPNANQFLNNKDFTLSFWVKASSTKNGHFVLGLAAWHGFQFEIAGDWGWVKLALRHEAADGSKLSEDSFYNGTGQTRDNGGWQGWTVNKDVSATGGVGDTYFKDKWANVVVTYNSVSKVNTMYINGQKVKEHDFNLWPDGDKKKTITGVKYDGTATGNKLALGFIQGRENRIIGDDWANFATGGNQFKGLLDDVRIFNKAITATEVQLMYNSEKP